MTLLNLILVFQLLFISSCASIMKGTDETMYVRSEVSGTTLYWNNIEIGTDEAKAIVLKKKLKNSKFVAKKEGCQTATVDIETRFDSTTLLGLFIDLGLISILVVDWAAYGSVREAEKLNYVLSPVCPAPTEKI